MKKLLVFPVLLVFLFVILCGCTSETNTSTLDYSQYKGYVYTELISYCIGTTEEQNLDPNNWFFYNVIHISANCPAITSYLMRTETIADLESREAKWSPCYYCWLGHDYKLNN